TRSRRCTPKRWCSLSPAQVSTTLGRCNLLGFNELRRHWGKHSVLPFSAQHLGSKRTLPFAYCFGPPAPWRAGMMDGGGYEVSVATASSSFQHQSLRRSSVKFQGR